MNRLDEFKLVVNLYTDYVDQYKVLINTHNVEFITENQWSDENVISSNTRQNLESYIDNASAHTETPNLFKLYLSNTPNPSYSNLNELFTNLKNFDKIWTEQVLTPVEFVFDPNNQNLNDFEKTFESKLHTIRKQNRFMNDKKTYEVDLMSKFVAKLCINKNIITIVDIGSGRAYLSSQLSSPLFDSQFNVIAIDSSQSNVESSKKRYDVLKRKTTLFKKENGKEDVKNSNNFYTFSQFIQSTTELNNLIDLENKKLSNTNCSYALIGLHSCGNLSNSIVNLYLNKSSDNNKSEDEQVKISPKLLCNVACCYNMLNEKYSQDDEYLSDLKHTNVKLDDSSKFPLSSYLNEKKYYLNFNSRMLACHSLHYSLANINDPEEFNYLSLWYRTVLQVILLDKFYEPIEQQNNACSKKYFRNKFNREEIIEPTRIQVGRNLIKEKKDQKPPDFVLYVRNALDRLKFNDHDLYISDDEIKSYYERHLPFKSRFDLYIQLKLLIAPIIEYVILLDRLIYLYEHENLTNNYLVRLFDPVKSPRCHAMVSFK